VWAKITPVRTDRSKHARERLETSHGCRLFTDRCETGAWTDQSCNELHVSIMNLTESYWRICVRYLHACLASDGLMSTSADQQRARDSRLPTSAACLALWSLAFRHGALDQLAHAWTHLAMLGRHATPPGASQHDMTIVPHGLRVDAA